MQNIKLPVIKKRFALLGTAIVGFLSITSPAQTEKVLHSFANNGRDGYGPVAGMIFDASGNLYGTTTNGGVDFAGTIFELSPKAGGGWTERVLHSFDPNAKDGNDPLGGLIMDRAGNLYGATLYGGANNTGTVFELVPKTGGGWAERVLYSFGNTGTSAESPVGSLVFDAAGNLYGTTAYGGSGKDCVSGCGTVFELSLGKGGRWTEKTLHNFTINGTDGSTPWAGLTLDPAGNLYGTTSAGGPGDCNGGCGVVFQLTPAAGGTWVETILHNFNSDGTDGLETFAGLALDNSGNLYGTTTYGGAHNYGTVFELSPSAGGGWTESILHSFAANGDGAYPHYDRVVLDAVGNLYGTTYEGGLTNGYGTVFELSLSSGAWVETILSGFNLTDGGYPQGGVTLDGKGNVYGTTANGGASGEGTVFNITR